MQRSEALQNKTEKTSSVTKQAILSPAASSHFAPGVERRKVRFASEPTADSQCFYENDAEVVISPAQPSTQASLIHASEQNEVASWDLSDLEDAAAIRRMLISTIDTPRSSSDGSLPSSSFVDSHYDLNPSGSEPVFHELCGSSMDSASPQGFSTSAGQTGD